MEVIPNFGLSGLRLALRGLKRVKNSRHLSSAPPKLDAKSQSSNEGMTAGKHLQITANNTRLPVIAKALVTDVRLESPRIRGITLKVEEPLFNFKAGQWVDMFIPGMETVGGFSMYSSPIQLAESGTLDLGIKFSKWPPAYWIHDKCSVGSTVAVRAGGDFYYAPEIGDKSFDLLLVAGGVGVNPLASMFFHAYDLYKSYLENPEEYQPGKIFLLYSARSYEELVYKPALDAVVERCPQMKVKYFVTREKPTGSSNVNYGHITTESLELALEELDKSSLQTFLCGPPPMIENIKKHLLNCGLPQNQILYEKWW